MSDTGPPTKSERAADELSAYLRARNPLLWVSTREEKRVERAIIDRAKTGYRMEPVFWDCAAGLTSADGSTIDAGLNDPLGILNHIRDNTDRRLYVLRDFHRELELDRTIPRALRNLARQLTNVPLTDARAVCILAPTAEIPAQISPHAILIDWPLPERPEIARIYDQACAGHLQGLSNLLEDPRTPAEARPRILAQIDRFRASTTNGQRERAIDAAAGLTSQEIEGAYAESIISSQDNTIDPDRVAATKRRLVAESIGVEWLDPDPRGMNAVGGLDLAKTWIAQRRLGLSKAAREAGLPAPRGMLCVGWSGTGKSLIAKATAAEWHLPLLRCDLGASKSKYVGASEERIRKVLKLAETIAPCVLLFDEIEKALAGDSQSNDGGVSADQRGALLTWMQERTAPVFCVMTANDVRALPPELMRKGRLDEVFFVDLPTRADRVAVLAATLDRYGRGMAGIDLDAVARTTDGFSGAELAALIPDAMFAAFADGAREITTDDVLAAARVVTPLSKTAAERLTDLRKWAEGRCRPAALPEQKAGQRDGRQLDI